MCAMNILTAEGKDLTAEKFEQLKAEKEEQQKAKYPLSTIDCRFHIILQNFRPRARLTEYSS